MERSAHGYWLADVGPVTAEAVLPPGAHSADVAVIGGGYLGMWTAWRLAERGADVVLCESGICGEGPSGRNGGFVNPLWDRSEELRELFGDDGAKRLAHASEQAIDDIERWATDQGVDIHLRRAPMLEVASAPSQVGSWRGAVAACQALGREQEVHEIDGRAARALCASPLFEAGVLWNTSATLHPARLARGLRQALIEHDRVRLFEGTRIIDFEERPGGIRLRSDRNASITADAAVLAINHASGALKPLRRAVVSGSSHAVATEPVPDVLEEIGWTGGEGIADCRTMLHYLRTTQDHRIVFGWGGGRMGFGTRRRGALDVDAEVQDTVVRHLFQMIPQLAGRKVEYAWGGPIDVSPVHLPWFGSIGRLHWGCGFTGNGVGPTSLGGHVLADLALDLKTEHTALPNVGGMPPTLFPPEPFKYLAGTAIRSALIRIDDADQAGHRAGPVARGIGALPNKLGLHLPR